MFGHQIEGMFQAIKHHFIGFSDESVKAALMDYWKDKIAITWTVEDVLSNENEHGRVISYPDARLVLQRALKNHDCEFGISWQMLHDLAGSVPSRALHLTLMKNRRSTYYLNSRGRCCRWTGVPQ